MDIYCWFSGGRDSAVACKLAHDVAQIRGYGFKLIHIDTTTPRPKDVDEYLYRYARWLDVELIILKPRYTFKELASRYPYWPSLGQRHRWCYYHLKRDVIINFLRENRDAIKALHVFAVRRDESVFREKEYDKVFTYKCYMERLCINVWLPLLYVDEIMVGTLIKKWDIPESPVWHKLGYSGECQCLAGTSYRTLVKLYIYYPEVVRELAEIDDVIQSNRRSKEPSYPVPLYGKKMTLRQWLKYMERQPRLTEWIEHYTGKSCSSCML